MWFAMLLIANGGCGVRHEHEQDAAGPTPEDVKQYSEEVRSAIALRTSSFLALQPTLSTTLGVESAAVGGAYANRVPDYTAAGMKSVQDLMTQASGELDRVDMERLDVATKTHVDVLKVIREYYKGEATFYAGYVDTWGGHLPYVVNQISGPLIDVPRVMETEQSISSLSDADDYLDRLSALATLAKQIREKLLADASTGVVLPKKLFPNTLEFFARFLEEQPARHPLVVSFAERLKALENVDASEVHRRVARAEAIIRNDVFPAYDAVRAELEGLRDRAPDGDGVWAQPGGAAFYAHAVRFLGDTDASPEEIHYLGRQEVDRITAEMDAILQRLGRTEGSVGERVVAISEDPSSYYPNTDEGRQALLADLRAWTDEIWQRAPELFPTLPGQAVDVRRVPEDAEAGGSTAYYTGPSLDGSRPGVFWINMRDMEQLPKFAMKTLTYHEAVPGHHFQISLNMALDDVGLARQTAPFNAYVEGWALYAEQLGAELGMYEDDPLGDLGRLRDELFRAVRLVVDTGLHHKMWSREQAISYMATTTGTSMGEVEAEVERYMAWPGQALGYKIGMIKILELRTMAQDRLGEAFKLREFHDVVLRDGAVPLSVLQSNVESWISAQES